MAFSADDVELVTGSADMTCRVWRVETGECLQVLSGHRGVVLASYNADASMILTISKVVLVSPRDVLRGAPDHLQGNCRQGPAGRFSGESRPGRPRPQRHRNDQMGRVSLCSAGGFSYSAFQKGPFHPRNPRQDRRTASTGRGERGGEPDQAPPSFSAFPPPLARAGGHPAARSTSNRMTE